MKLYYIKQYHKIDSQLRHCFNFPLNLYTNDKDEIDEKTKYFFSYDSAEKYIFKHYTEPEKFTYPFKIKSPYRSSSLPFEYVSFNVFNVSNSIVYRICEEEW